MGEIKAQLLGIVAVVVTFGIISSAIFLAFDTLAADVADDITAVVEYKTESEPTSLVRKDYNVSISNDKLLSF